MRYRLQSMLTEIIKQIDVTTSSLSFGIHTYPIQAGADVPTLIHGIIHILQVLHYDKNTPLHISFTVQRNLLPSY